MKRRSGAAPADGNVRPACGAYALMPGATAARFVMPRALSGRFSISSRSTGALTESRCTSTCRTRRDSAVTLTADSSVAPRSSANVSRARCPTTSCTASPAGRKPMARTATRSAPT
jgi:hypothetical protein